MLSANFLPLPLLPAFRATTPSFPSHPKASSSYLLHLLPPAELIDLCTICQSPWPAEAAALHVQCCKLKEGKLHILHSASLIWKCVYIIKKMVWCLRFIPPSFFCTKQTYFLWCVIKATLSNHFALNQHFKNHFDDAQPCNKVRGVSVSVSLRPECQLLCYVTRRLGERSVSTKTAKHEEADSTLQLVDASE